jgi:hemolysin III
MCINSKEGEIMHNEVNEFTLNEEIWHAITHGIGLALSIAGLIVLVIYSNTTISIASSAIFGSTLIVLYASSTLYHAITHTKAKKIFQILDHASIYVLIAGTYTPITLLVLQGAWGWSIFGVIWGLAILGISLKILYPNRFETFSLILYVVMGWMIIVALNPLFENMPSGGLWLLLLGGLSYTFGVIFYIKDKMPYSHAIWHMFVLAGSLFHYFMVLFYII